MVLAQDGTVPQCNGSTWERIHMQLTLTLILGVEGSRGPGPFPVGFFLRPTRTGPGPFLTGF